MIDIWSLGMIFRGEVWDGAGISDVIEVTGRTIEPSPCNEDSFTSHEGDLSYFSSNVMSSPSWASSWLLLSSKVTDGASFVSRGTFEDDVWTETSSDTKSSHSRAPGWLHSSSKVGDGGPFVPCGIFENDVCLGMSSLRDIDWVPLSICCLIEDHVVKIGPDRKG